MRYILYARKSSESEDRQVQSIDDQTRILREIAENRGLQIVEEITESRSAKDPGARAGFEEMLKKIERGHADAILCWAINRLTRNPVDSGKLSWLLQSGPLLVIHTPEKQFLPSDNVLLFAVETGTANQFILDLKKSVARGTQSKLEKGWAPYSAPEGYINETYDHTIQPDPERFETIQRAWKLLIAGTHTVAQVHNILNEEWGFTTRRRHRSGGKKLSRTTVYDMFTNPFYAGFFRYKDTIYKGSHLPMISMADYEQAQKNIRGQVQKRRPSKHEFPYSGLLSCAHCGGGVTTSIQKGRHGRGHYIYYHCARRREGAIATGCNRQGIRQELLEGEMDRLLSGLTISREVGDIVRDTLRDWAKAEFGSLDSIYEEQSRTLVENERRLSELLDLRLSGVIDTAMYQTKEASLKLAIGQMRMEVSKVQSQLDETRRTVENAIAFSETAHLRFQNGGIFERREVARLLGVRYVLQDRQIEIELTPILRELNQITRGISAGIEPLKSGSGKTKRTASTNAVLHGWTTRTKIETLYAFFRLIGTEKMHFPAPTWTLAS